MAKLIGALMLALAGWWGGAVVCSQVTAHRVALGETIALLKVLEEEIAFRHANLAQLYQRFAREESFPSLGLVLDASTGQVQDNIPCFQKLLAPSSFRKEEKALFSLCFARLGYTSASQECERLIRYRKQFESFYEKILVEEQSALAIDQKIGIALGSMLALVLL